MEILQDGNTNYYLNKTESTNWAEGYTEFFPIEFQKKSKVAEYFDYVYNYPPKIKDLERTGSAKPNFRIWRL